MCSLYKICLLLHMVANMFRYSRIFPVESIFLLYPTDSTCKSFRINPRP